MKQIIGMIRPFELRQQFYVYEDGNKIAVEHPKMDEIYETVFGFMKNFDVNKLVLVGPKQYNRGLSKKIKEAEMTKFNKNILEINEI